jgi:hypothetical protein
MLIDLAVGKVYVTAVAAIVAMKVGFSPLMWTEQAWL